MEKQSKRTSNKMEDAKGCGSRSFITLDDYLTVPGSDAEDLGPEKHDVEGHPGGAGGREIGETGQNGQVPGAIQMGSHPGGCHILDRENGSYPCWNCPGGLSFSECERLRGVLKR